MPLFRSTGGRVYIPTSRRLFFLEREPVIERTKETNEHRIMWPSGTPGRIVSDAIDQLSTD